MIDIRTATTRRTRACRSNRERGSHTTEFVIGITIVVAIATVVGAILLDTFTGAAQSIDLGLTK